jgi:hypothetical protein
MWQDLKGIDGDSMVFQNVGILPHHCMASQSKDHSLDILPWLLFKNKRLLRN